LMQLALNDPTMSSRKVYRTTSIQDPASTTITENLQYFHKPYNIQSSYQPLR
jgi:hypothetical protein